MKRSFLADVITYFFILLFLYTGIAKLMEVHTFKEQLASSPLMATMSGIIAWALPISEILLGIVLFIPAWRLKGLYITLVMMALFTGYVIFILLIDSHISCSCGGIIEELTPKQHIIFNSACVVLSLVGIGVIRKAEPNVRFKWVANTSAICLFLLVGWTLFTAFTTPSTPKTGLEGRLLPSFDLLLADSVTHLNTANIPTGKPIVIIGFSPFCKHCQAETEAIIKHIKTFENCRIYYITPYPFNQLKLFYDHYKLGQYSNITTGRDVNNAFFAYFKSTSTPYTVILDPQKRVKLVLVGQVDEVKLAKAIAE